MRADAEAIVYTGWYVDWSGAHIVLQLLIDQRGSIFLMPQLPS